MDKGIEVKIKHHYMGITALFAVCTCVVIFSFGYMVVYLIHKFYAETALHAMIFIMSLAGLVLSAVLSCKPTVIRSDGMMLYWQFIYKKHELSLNEIARADCEPYSVHGRYGSRQRISLRLLTKDGTEIEFNDDVDANDLLNEKLGNKHADVPILKLYEYLNAHCGRSDN